MHRFSGNSQHSAIMAWVLIAILMLQPLLTYLATPLLASEGEGRIVQLCTLNGLKAVHVDDLQPLSTQSDDEHCPALRLLQLAGTVRPATPLEAPAIFLYPVALADTVVKDRPGAHTGSIYPIRAPPMC